MDVIEFKDETLKSTILQLLVSNQTEVLSMIPTKRSLEEIFVAEAVKEKSVS